MKTTFLVLSAIFIVLIGACCIFLKKKKSDIARILLALNLNGIFSIIFYSLSLVQTKETSAYVLSSLYYASIHWIVIFFLNFVFELAEINRRKKLILNFARVWGIFILYDTISLLLNTVFHNIFTLNPFYSDGSLFYWAPSYHTPFTLHLLFCYILVILSITVLTVKAVTTNKFYRQKYISVVSVFVFVIIINAGFLLTKMQLDFSMLFYSSLSLTATYFTIFSLPRRIENTMMQLVSENLNNAIICFDDEKKCIYSNKSAGLYFPSPSEIKNELDDLLNLHRELIIRNINLKKDGQEITLAEEFSYMKDANDKLLGYSIRLSDITEELKAVKEEQHHSTHDALTSLLNRESFYLEAESIIRNDPDTKRCLICTNISSFKLINDLFGSHFGDELLKHQAKVLTEQGIPDALLGRISGDHFAILIKKEYFNHDQFLEIIEKIQSFTAEVNYRLHVFMGVYEISDPYEKVSSMYDKAHLAIKNISENYAVSIAWYDTKLLAALLETKNIIAAFEDSLADGQFKMYLQPQINTSTEKIIGAEALVRWIHPEKGILNPSSFVPVLEETGYLYKLDKYIWTLAAKTLAKWQKLGLNHYIAVNISARDFYHVDIYKVFTSLINEYEIDPSLLRLEITETVLMHDLYMHKKILSQLQEAGFIIEMDDFGSGYSSLNMLKNVNIDVLKIDMTFLQQTKNEERSKTILRSIVKMVKELNIKVIAEGVEEPAQAEYLKALGCDVFQGFLYSKPVSVRDFEAILREKEI